MHTGILLNEPPLTVQDMVVDGMVNYSANSIYNEPDAGNEF